MLPSQIIPGLPERVALGKMMELLFSDELVSCPGQKSHQISLNEPQKPKPVPALGAATPRMPIPVEDKPHWRPLTNTESQQAVP